MTETAKDDRHAKSAASKLSRQDWLDAAKRALSLHGIEGVSIQAIAKDLGVTKGSFYWHFRDREHLCDEILTEWRLRCTIDLVEGAGGSRDPHQQLRQLAQIALTPTDDEEPAHLALGLQLWARTNPKARAILDEIDDLRIRSLTKLLVDCGLEAAEAKARSVLAYTYLRAGMWRVHREDHELLAQCEAVLFEGILTRN